MKVTPEREAPIIPNATTYQGDFLLPMKKDSLSAPREVTHETRINRKKYETITDSSKRGDITFTLEAAKIGILF